MKTLVPFVEGEGEMYAVPELLRRLLTYHALHDTIRVDDRPFNVRGFSGLRAEEGARWQRWLKAALKRPDTGGVLVVVDGDFKKPGGGFCSRDEAQALVEYARKVGAGAVFSVAVVFASQEYESWLLAGVESLAGKPMSDRRIGVRPGTPTFEGNLELAPRDAKGALGKLMHSGYKATLDQAELTKLIDLEVVRRRGLRSFKRLESALQELANAFRTGEHIATPSRPAN